jgi:DDE superfamily endonuclease
MQHSHRLPGSSGSPLPERFLSRLVGFADLFTRPTWSTVLVLLAGAILAPGRRTVSATLRILGRECDPDFCTFHRILNRSAWSPRGVARQLLCLLVKVLVPVGAPVVIGIDDTIERRWGAKISARGIYRDPVRSSKGHFVKASGLRWLSAMLLVRVPWADRVMALPFLTLLAPSKRFYSDKTRAPKTLLDWARQAALQIHRWLPDRYIVLVGDSAFAAIEFLAAVRNYVCVITRLRLDANLFDFPPQKRKGRGRRPIKGKPLKKLSAVIKDRKVSWKRYRVSLWYGRTNRLVEIATGTAMWYRGGVPPVPIRWLLVAIQKASSTRKPSSRPISTLDPATFSAGSSVAGRSRSHLQKFELISAWRPNASGQTKQSFAPRQSLLGLFSIVTLWAHDLSKSRKLKPRTAAWYPKAVLTFSDAIAAVRREIWRHQISFMSRPSRDSIEIPSIIWQRMENALAYAA